MSQPRCLDPFGEDPWKPNSTQCKAGHATTRLCKAVSWAFWVCGRTSNDPQDILSANQNVPDFPGHVSAWASGLRRKPRSGKRHTAEQLKDIEGAKRWLK
eukprot:s712_g10.t1